MHDVELVLLHCLPATDEEAAYVLRVRDEARRRGLPIHIAGVEPVPPTGRPEPVLIVKIDDIPERSHTGVLDEATLHDVLDSYTCQPAGCW